MTVLVTAASRHGSTDEIAAAIGDVLVRHGLEVEVAPLSAVATVEPYDAVVLGSAIYYGKWLDEATEFVHRHADALHARAVWLFSSGPLGPEAQHPLPRGSNIEELVARVGAHSHEEFTGKLDPERLGLIERTVARGVRAQVGDFRDWFLIAAWASSIAETLTRADTSDGPDADPLEPAR